MSGNNPSNMVTVQIDEDLEIQTHAGLVCYEAGEKVTMTKAQYAHCAPSVTLVHASCEDTRMVITIEANGTYETEIPKGTGHRHSVCITSCACLAYLLGTDTTPLDIPADLAEVTNGAPKLLLEGENTVSFLADDGTYATDLGLINTSSEDVVVELLFKGCIS